MVNGIMYIISIIIPVYNVEPYIKRSLLSALNQTFDSIEYIIVDDCGTDKSMDIVKQIIRDHSRGKHVYIYKHKKNRGLSAARNTGLERARGEYIFFFDSDDEITENCIFLHYQRIISEKSDITIAKMKLVGVKSIHIKRINFCIKVGNDILKSFFKRKWPDSAWNKLYKRKIVLENNICFVEGMLYEDHLWNYHIAKKINKIAVVPEATYIYKIRNNSIVTSRASFEKIDGLLYNQKYLILDWERGGINRELYKYFCSYLTFKRFNASLLLLLMTDSMAKRNEYYRIINAEEYSKYTDRGILAGLLKLPFYLFLILLKPLYLLYKLKK
jgi:glycosyltransferase involved in cell wall biosynthesis